MRHATPVRRKALQSIVRFWLWRSVSQRPRLSMASVTLQDIQSPQDLRALKRSDLNALAHELREFVLQSVAQTGGHLSSNLGVVELTLALHYVFETPNRSEAHT